jgi:predicted transport protein
MPLFEIAGQDVNSVKQTNFDSEKVLQNLVERNLETIFNCRFVASEFSTGANHAGRIDTLALSEENNPVIIEYKKVESSELINQSLFYLSWLHDHRGDFELTVQRKLGIDIEVDWTDLRVICIAPGYKRYDLHAVQVMGANIELWRYRLFSNSTIYFEEVFRQNYPEKILPSDPSDDGKNPVMVAAGKKAAATRSTGNYSFDEHLVGKSKHLQDLSLVVNDFITGLDSAIEQNPKKFYIAYKISQNIVCMEIKRHHIALYLKLKSSDIDVPPANYRDVTEIGHYGTGDSEFIVKSENDFTLAKPFIELAYLKVGG